MKLDRKSAGSPLYQQVKEFLEEKIKSKDCKIGDILPSELELKERFNVSRSTIRQAFYELSKEGYIERKRGKGTIIKKKFIKPIEKIINFIEEIKDKGSRGMYIRKVEISTVNIDASIGEKMNLKIGDKVSKVRTILSFWKVPIAYFETYLTNELEFPDNFSGFKECLYGELKRCNDLKVGKKIETFEITNADTEINNTLCINEEIPLVKTTRISYDSEGRIFEYTMSYTVIDKYSLYIETEFS